MRNMRFGPWEKIKLGKIIEIVKGKKVRLVSCQQNFVTMPYLTTEYLRTGTPNQFVLNPEEGIIVEKKDILLLWDGSNAGEFFLFSGEKGILSSTMCKLLIKEKVEKLFFYYLLKFYVEGRLKLQTKGTGIPHVDRNTFMEILIPLPPLPEQKKIAEILGDVDEAIEKVEKIIEKTERIKKGLMRELLTRGTGHKEFKKTEIGTIPKEWKVVRLGEVITDILTGATPLRTERKYWVNGKIPWLTNNEVEDNKINYIYDTREKITDIALKETNVKLIPENSLILSLTASVGKVAINKVKITTNQQFNSFVLDVQKALPEFMGYYFLFAKKRIEQMGGTTTFKFINKNTIQKFPIPLPPLSEQKKIVGILMEVDKKLEMERKRKEKLEKLKKGLMEDLLTGKRRVRV